MKKMYREVNISCQSGSVLIVSLILLLVITILGLANIRTATMEMRMSTSAKDRSLAFEAAEAVLRSVENELSINPPLKDDVLNTCSGASCFNASCSNDGLCFDGDFDPTDNEIECEVAVNAGTTERVAYWSDTGLDVWDTDTRHSTMSIPGLDNEVKYITEFLCYAAPDAGTIFDASSGNENNGEPLFRITAYAEGNSGAQVMLQSTYIAIGAF